MVFVFGVSLFDAPAQAGPIYLAAKRVVKNATIALATYFGIGNASLESVLLFLVLTGLDKFINEIRSDAGLPARK